MPEVHSRIGVAGNMRSTLVSVYSLQRDAACDALGTEQRTQILTVATLLGCFVEIIPRPCPLLSLCASRPVKRPKRLYVHLEGHLFL